MHASSRRSLAGALALAILAAIPAGAQQAALVDAPSGAPMQPASAEAITPVDAAPVAGPTVDQAAVAVRAPAQAHEQQATTAAAARAGLGTARAQMIVGFAALVAGAIIGDTPGTIIMIAGAAVGLWGLYNYLQ